MTKLSTSPPRRAVSTRSRTRRPLSVVSYFSGCGGLDLGFMGGFKYKNITVPRTRFEIIAAYDIESRCVTTYHKNIGPHAQVADLARLDPKDVPAADILIGGFPCQEFSRCGPRKGLKGKRGRLFRSLVRYAKEHKPLAIVGENVADLVSLNDGRDFIVMEREFAAAGYRSIVWDVQAADYGVPQSRNRVFLLFLRKDIQGHPHEPTPRYRAAHRGVKWAIDDLVAVTDGSVSNQDQYFKAARAKRGHGQGDERSVAHAPGYTVRANAKSRVQFHYALRRRLTVRECARLQTFPDWFVFPHDATTNVRQIGNAVPPLLAHKVARSLGRFLHAAIRRKNR